MIVVGVDLAANRSRTAVTRIAWVDRGPLVTDVLLDADDEAILRLARGADKIGVDCPLGWPLPFVRFVDAHMAGRVDTPADTVAARRGLVYRATDLHCRTLGLRPLSVAADRIAHAALRCAPLLARLGDTDRSGAGRVVEAYPAGSLQVWGLPHRGYKTDPDQLAASLARLETAVGFGFADAGDRRRCAASDHAFDALVAALTARAAALGRTGAPPPELSHVARREGWIAVPECGPAALR